MPIDDIGYVNNNINVRNKFKNIFIFPFIIILSVIVLYNTSTLLKTATIISNSILDILNLLKIIHDDYIIILTAIRKNNPYIFSYIFIPIGFIYSIRFLLILTKNWLYRLAALLFIVSVVLVLMQPIDFSLTIANICWGLAIILLTVYFCRNCPKAKDEGEAKTSSDEKKSISIRTGISQPFYCEYNNKKKCEEAQNCKLKETENCQGEWPCVKFSPARFSLDSNQNGKNAPYTSWLDSLFHGKNILIPHEGKPVIFLLRGPAGCGKTTLALELCYRLARNRWSHVEGMQEKDFLNSKSISSWYISTETETNAIIEHAKSFSWEKADRYVNEISEENIDKIKKNLAGAKGWAKSSIVSVYGKEKIREGKWTLYSIARSLISEYIKANKKTFSLEIFFMLFTKWLPVKYKWWPHAIFKLAPELAPELIVLDSLNNIEGMTTKDEFYKFLDEQQKVNDRLKMVVFIMDDTSSQEKHALFESVADVQIKLDYESIDHSFARTIEILETRYQSHVPGKAYFQILPSNIPKSKKLCEYALMCEHSHPYRKEGGIFIFPSIDFFIRKYCKTTTPAPIKNLPIYPAGLNELVDLPAGRSTSIIGKKSAHRSQVAYLTALKRLIEGDSLMIISLRGDERQTKHTLQTILDREFTQKPYNISDYIWDNKLEIIHCFPGNMVASEFFHRLFISIKKLKANMIDNKEFLVIFDDLEELEPRFPYCIEEKVFFPGIIDMLFREKITSIFIKDEKQQYGILPMSALVLSASREKIKYRDYTEHIKTYLSTFLKHDFDMLFKKDQTDSLEIENVKNILFKKGYIDKHNKIDFNMIKNNFEEFFQTQLNSSKNKNIVDFDKIIAKLNMSIGIDSRYEKDIIKIILKKMQQYDNLIEKYEELKNEHKNLDNLYHEHNIIKVDKYAGGHENNSKIGVIELVEDPKNTLYDKPGLYFIPFDPWLKIDSDSLNQS